VGCEGGTHFYAMRFIAGRTLAEVIRERQHGKHDPPYRTIAAQIAEAASALHHAHEQGVIHRDVKPSNLMLDDDGKIWVTDFGLAHIESGQALTMTGDLLGTLRYMSPEQAFGGRLSVDHRADVYSLGATLYEMLTLRPVFGGEEQARIVQQIAGEDPAAPRQLNKSIPAELEIITLKALRKNAVDRYPTAEALAEDLRRYVENKPIRARRPGLVEVAKKCAARHAALVVLTLSASAVLTVTLAVAALLLWREQGHTQTALKTAQENFIAARAQQRQAETYSAQVRLRLYAADMRLAFQAWNRANLKQTVDLLDRYLPAVNQEDLRGFEWHYLWRLCHDERLLLSGHKRDVYWVAYSPDGERLVTAGEDETARVWNAADGQELMVLRGHVGAVRMALYAPFGKRIATAGDDGTIKLWDSATGQLLSSLADHTGELRALAFSPDGRWLGSGGLDDTARLWDTDALRSVSVFRGHFRGVRGVAFSPDSQTLATAAGDHLIKLWSIATHREQASLTGNLTWACGVAFSPDGKTVAGCAWGPEMRIWDAISGNEIRELSEHGNHVLSIAFHPDGKSLLSASRDSTVRVWDLAAGRSTRVLRAHPGPVWCAAFSPAGRQIATAAEGVVKVWNDDSQAPYVRLPVDWPAPRVPGGSFMLSASLSAGGDRLVYFTSLDEHLRVLDLATNETTLTQLSEDDGQEFKCLDISPDGQLLATGAGRGLVQLWDFPSGQERARLVGHSAYVHSVAFSPDGRRLASGDSSGDGSVQGTLLLWDLATGQYLDLPYRSSGVRDLAFSPNGLLLAAAGEEVQIWRVADGQVCGELKGHGQGVGAVRFSPDGNLMASGSDDRAVRLWDTATGALLHTMLGHSGNVGSLAFSPDGRTLVSASHDGTIRLWHVATGQEMAVFEGHTSVSSIAFCLQGRALASLGSKELLLWSAQRATTDH
jgi:eukaryotic-like serine/threonine-protein kinase